MKKLLVTLVVAAAAIGGLAAPAQATCTPVGHVIGVEDYGGYAYVTLKTNPLSSVSYYGYTTDESLTQLAATALQSQTRVYVSGNASSCPTTGTVRYLGTLSYVTMGW